MASCFFPHLVFSPPPFHVSLRVPSSSILIPENNLSSVYQVQRCYRVRTRGTFVFCCWDHRCPPPHVKLIFANSPDGAKFACSCMAMSCTTPPCLPQV